MDNLSRLFDLANLNVHAVVGADVNIASLAQLIASGNFLQQRSAESGSTVLQFNLLGSVGQRLAALQNVADIDNLGRLLNLANLNVHGIVGADVNIAGLAQFIASGDFLQQRSAESGSTVLQFNLLGSVGQRLAALQNVADVNKFGSGLELVADVSSLIVIASSPAIHFSPSEGFPTSQLRSTGIRNPLTASSFRRRRADAILHYFTGSSIAIFCEIDNNFLTLSRIRCRCKRCKRYAHDNHERGRQQSKQTSFEILFLHVKSPIL